MTDTTARPLSYPSDAILTRAEVAAWLGKNERQVFRMGIKHAEGLYLAAWVYQYLEAKAA